jgi:hypothetical protein
VVEGFAAATEPTLVEQAASTSFDEHGISGVSSSLDRAPSPGVRRSAARPRLNSLANICAVAAIGGGFLFTLAWAVQRSSVDWHYQVRLIRVLSLAAGSDSGASSQLWEVALVGGTLCASSRSITFSFVDNPRDAGVLLLPTPLEEMADRCTCWGQAGTPLLLSADARGAVLHGPGGYLLGQLATGEASKPFDPSRPW